MRSNNKIYSLHTSPDSSGLLQIETVVVGGMYNFSILGVPVRYANDVKHKVYTALRAEGVLNLKSDNRKITCNIISDREDIVPTHTELALAISCLCCMSKNVDINPSIVVGAISITGNIIPTHHILQAIYLAKTNNIQQIICSTGDIEAIKTEYIDHALTVGIRFVVGDSIKEVISNIESNNYYIPEKNTAADKIPDSELIMKTIKELKDFHMEWSLVVAICGRHNILIETDHSTYIEDTINSIYKYIPKPTINSLLKLVGICKLEDILFQTKIDLYQPTKIPANTTRKIPKDPLSPFTFFENITSTSLGIADSYYINSTYLLLSTCQYCPCGNLGSETKKCLCLQRNILKHQQKLNTDHKKHYNLWVSHRVKHQNSFDWSEFGPVIADIISIAHSAVFRPQFEPKTEVLLTKLGESLSLDQKQSLVRIANTLQVLTELEQGRLDQTKRPTLISTKNLLLAFSYLPRMDS